MDYNKELLQRLIDFKDKSGLNQTQISRAVGVAPAAISMYLKGTYKENGGNYETIEPKIKAFLDAEDEKAKRDELIIEFVQTRTAQRVAEVMRDAHLDGEVVVVSGQAGLGKTQAVKAYCTSQPAAILVEANPSFNALVMMRKLAEACKLNSNGSINDLYELICERLKGSGRMIVVDEAENLPLRALELLRRLQDETGCGLAMVGMPTLVANLRGKHGHLAQLYSRVSLHLNLGDTLPDDELEIIARKALPQADDDTIAALVKHSNGNTRRMSKIMRGAVRTAKKNGVAVQAKIVKMYSQLIIR